FPISRVDPVRGQSTLWPTIPSTMRSIISYFMLPMVLSFPSNNFLSPGREENYLAAGYWRADSPAETVSGVKTESDLGGGFWPSAKFLMLRRRNKLKGSTTTTIPITTGDEKGITDEWDLYKGTKSSGDSSSTSAVPPLGTTILPPIVVPLPPSPTIDEVALRAKLLKGTPPKFLAGGSVEAKVSFAKIGMGGKLTKAQLRQAYSEWADKQEPVIKEAFYREREEHDLGIKGLRKKMMEKSKSRLSVEARTLYDQIQTVHDNEDLTLDENIGLVQEILNGADESVRKELHDMKKRFAILV
ncbi:hypothetical protein PMAYCL1PPCAC_23483, partial [Pristionchus mayeri]